MATPFDTDIFIAGGGPAGLVAAIAARRKGFRVTVADSAHSAIDKACGEGLMPDAVEVLAGLGVSFAPEEYVPFHGIRFCGHDRAVEAAFPNGEGYGVRRTTLHRILAAKAGEAGVTLLWDSPVTGLEGQRVQMRNQSMTARFIVGADGAASAVRRWAGLDARLRDSHRFGFRRHFQVTPWTDHVEVHWASGCQIYVTPVAADQVNVALLSRSSDLRLDQALPLFPDLAQRLRGAVPASAERGSISASRRLRRACHGHVALIGDASGSVDAVTGEGLSLAFQQALALASAMELDDLGLYQAAHTRIRRRPALMADLMLLMDQRDRLRRRVFSVLSARPTLFADMLSMHVRGFSPRVLMTAAVTLGWNLLTA
ncbi:NAD(P)/FAD-dependent oxidoreductase [uncultured Paludibaculum sp.]|uniref:NAD(P)/FAD-dependent oxidoreductase n=1 Tax=uncultured Paludibaculum sp. TaxID=1765020 RepID=UPI002AAB8039|nr:NAD(P)/FAD-dependent oxidoreductase [uncultured Paludibaculum sp.]